MAGVCVLALLAGCGKKAGSENSRGYDLEEAVTLGDYRGIEISLAKSEVTEEDVKSYVESMIAMYETVPVFHPVEKTQVEEGDAVNIDYEGLLDGEAFDGGTAEDQILVIGSGRFIDGFEEGLIGVNVGDSVSLNLTFPETYTLNPDMAGKAVVFNVTVNSIGETEEMTYEKLTDEYVADNFGAMGVETAQDLKDTANSYLTSSNEYYAASTRRTAVLEKLKELCTVEVPQELLDERVQEYKEQYEASVKEQYDMELADYLEQNYQVTLEEFETQSVEYMKEDITLEMILLAIAEQEGLEVDEEGYQEYLTNMVSNYGYESQDALIEEQGEDYLKDSYLCNKAVELVEENASITYTEPETDTESGDSQTEGGDTQTESGDGQAESGDTQTESGDSQE